MDLGLRLRYHGVKIMEKIKINIGIIDDDESKITQIISKIEDGVENADAEIVERYENYELVPIELEIKRDINEMLEQIVDCNVRALIVDYKLSSYATTVDYTGVKFAQRTNNKFYDFPIFILTSFEAELFKHEIFNAYQVFDSNRYLNEEKERIELNVKIIEQCLKYEKQIIEWEDELKQLLEHQGESDEVDSRIVELDSFLEKSIDGESALPLKTKNHLMNNNFEKLMDMMNAILEKEG